jgi:hypothetical protein
MPLVIRRASVHRPGHWGDADYDVVTGELVIGHVYRIEIARGDSAWRWHLHAISGAATEVRTSGHERDLDACGTRTMRIMKPPGAAKNEPQIP